MIDKRKFFFTVFLFVYGFETRSHAIYGGLKLNYVGRADLNTPDPLAPNSIMLKLDDWLLRFSEAHI